MARSIYEILIKLEGGKVTQQELEAAERQVNLLTQAADAVAPALLQAGSAMLDFSDRAAMANAEMERGLTNIQFLTGRTADEVAEYNDQLDGVLERTNFQISSNDTLTSSYDAMSAGFTESSDALGLLENSMNLAIAGTSGLDEASTNLRDAQKAVIVGLKNYGSELSQYGDTAAQAARVSDLLNQTIALGITDIKQLAPEFAEIAPNAAAAGLGIEELAGAYAAATSSGVKTTKVTTGLNAALAQISRGGSTKEAKELIEETGIAFNAQGLAAEGLIGVLEDLEQAGLTSYESLLQLTGDTEAAGFLANLTNNMDRTRETFASFNGELQSTADIAEGKASDGLSQLTAATNKFDRELAKAGENLSPVRAQLLSLAGEVLSAFNALPDGIQAVIGSMVVVGGATATATGSIIQLASNIAVARIAYMTWATQIGITDGLLTSLTAKVKASTAAQAIMNVQLKVTVSTLGALAGVAVTAAGAVASVTLAYKQYQNIKTQERNQELFSDLQTTEQLTQKVGALVLKMKETGEAVPESEFRQWIHLLEQADEGNGTLTRHIEILKKTQSQAKEGTLAKAKAQERDNEATVKGSRVAREATKSTEALKSEAELAAQAQEAQAEAARKASEANRQLLSTLQSGLGALSATIESSELALAQATQDGSMSTVQAYKERAQLLEMQERSVKTLYAETLRSEALLESERAGLIAQESQAMRGIQRQRLQLQQEYTRTLSQINQENSEKEMLALETRANQELWGEQRLTEAKRDLRARQLQTTLDTVEAEVGAVIRGSERERQLSLTKMRTLAEMAQLEADTQQDIIRANEEAKQAKIDAWQAETDAYLQQLQERESQAANIAARSQQANQAQQATNSLSGSVLGEFEGTLNARNKARERAIELTAQIAQLEREAKETGESRTQQIKEAKSELAQQKAIQALTNTELSNTRDLLRDLGVNVQTNLSAEQAQFAIVAQQLALKNEQVQLELQQERIKIRLQQLEQDRLILELQRAATMEGISETEARNLRMQIENAQATKALLNEQLRASEELAGLQQRANTQSARSGLATQGIDPKELGKEFEGATDKLGKTLGVSLDKLTDETREGAQQALEAYQRGAQEVGEGLTNLDKGISSTMDPINRGIMSGNGIQERGFGATLAATQAQTAELGAQLAALQAITAAIPSQIASSLPRPEPKSRGSE